MTLWTRPCYNWHRRERNAFPCPLKEWNAFLPVYRALWSICEAGRSAGRIKLARENSRTKLLYFQYYISCKATWKERSTTKDCTRSYIQICKICAFCLVNTSKKAYTKKRCCGFDWLIFNVTEQLRLWATPQCRTADNFPTGGFFNVHWGDDVGVAFFRGANEK